MWSAIKHILSLIIVAVENYNERRRQKKRDRLEADPVHFINSEFSGLRDDSVKTDKTDTNRD